MKSRITIEVDFDNGNAPYIRLIVDRSSDDVRDKLLRAFLEKLGHESVFGKIVCKSDAPTEENVQRWGIYPIPAEKIQEELSSLPEIISDRILYLDLLNSVETAIMKAVKKLGADERLTNAVELIQKAKDLVSDVLDEKLDRLARPV